MSHFQCIIPYPLFFPCAVLSAILDISFKLQELHKDDNSKDC